MQEQLAGLRGKAPDELLRAMMEATPEAYRPDVMAREIAQSLARSLKPAELQPVIAWLETDLGRRLVDAEKRSSAASSKVAAVTGRTRWDK